MEHQVTVDTGEINTSPVNVQMPLHQADLEESSVISTFSVSNQGKTQKEPFPRDWPRMRAYGAALVGGFAVVPSVAAAITVAIFLAELNVPGAYIVIWGMLVTLAAWLLISIPMSFLTSRDRVNARSYGLLISRLSQLETRLNVIQNRNPDPDKLEEYQEVALEEAYNNFQELDTMLYESTSRLPWVLGLGYVVAWFRIHRAEEALIDVEPVEMVVRGAFHDKMAITDSQMSNSSDLLNQLRTAVKALDPAMGDVFRTGDTSSQETEQLQDLLDNVRQLEKDMQQLGQGVQLIAKNSGGKLDDNQAHKKGPDQPGTKGPSPESEARLTIREIRQTLNEFRDHQWEGLIRARNRLMSGIFVTGLVTFLLLCIALLSASSGSSDSQSGHAALLAAAAFYVVGAIAGLFGTIYRESTMSIGVDDYGLSLARLIGTPMLSGLAGVGGAFLYSVLILQTTPSASLTISSIFTLSRLDYLIAAVIFGFAPNLIIKGLAQQSNKFISALQSSKASVITDPSDKQNSAN